MTQSPSDSCDSYESSHEPSNELSPVPPLCETVIENGETGLQWNLHTGQARALESLKRFILVLAGWQSGKSEIGPPWLWAEMIARGPGDYLVASPTFPLMTKKVLPVFTRLFERQLKLGKFVGGKNIFNFSEDGCQRLWRHVPDEPPRVLFGHAGDPESLESATVKAAWLDECGQAGFKMASYETILGRLSIHQGRVLMTSRPYSLGWMKQLLWDPWEAAKRNHPLIEIVNFRSIDNPAFPKEEYYRANPECQQAAGMNRLQHKSNQPHVGRSNRSPVRRRAPKCRRSIFDGQN